MIEIGKILKRAWQILWNYKVLWIFGILLALTSGGRAGSSANGGGGTNFPTSGGNGSQGFNPSSLPFFNDLNRWFQQNIYPLFLYPQQHVATFIDIGVGLVLFLLLVTAILLILRYVSEAAVIRMVNEYEQTGTKVGFRQGWKMGWSRAALRMWLIDLIIALHVLIFVLILIGLGLAAYFSVKSGNHALGIGAVVGAVICAFTFIIAFVILMVVLGLLSQFFKRMAALENTGVGESFRRGWQMVKRDWKSAALMWLVMLGLGIAYALGSIILFFLLIPVFVILALPGLIVAAIPALAAYGLTSLFASGPWTWIIAALVGLPVLFLILGSPLLLISGWVEIFSSTAWTLTFREMKALETVAPTGLSPTTP
jgi:hypothetical protein